jgi:glycerophosphoryl diester phosphodiesterase
VSGWCLRRDGGIWRVGHKGAAALAPANTIAAFERALEAGVDVVEFDVLDLEDGTLVLAHSDGLDDVTAGAAHGPVRSRSLGELRGLAPGLATLDEALEFLSRDGGGVRLHVDLKATGYERATVDALRRHGVVERTLVSTCFASSLREIADLEPGLERGLTYPYDRHGLSQRRVLAPVLGGGVVAMRAALPRRIGAMLERARAGVATLNHLVVSRAVVRRCHELDAAVFAWTVDGKRTAARLASAGVDGIVTNDPRIFGDT